MARFVFKLEAVLRHRRNTERQRQRDLAVLQAQMQQLQADVRAMDQQVRSATDDLRANGLCGRLDMEFITGHRRFVLGMQRKAMLLVQRMSLVQRNIDSSRAALAEAARQRKVMEKLRERHFERWRAALSLKESAELDEIGMQLSYRESLDSVA